MGTKPGHDVLRLSLGIGDEHGDRAPWKPLRPVGASRFRPGPPGAADRSAHGRRHQGRRGRQTRMT
eukprot:4292014-Pyramimonas_sp.AAC.1